MLHYRIDGFLHTELLIRDSFQSEGFHLRVPMKTQRLANIWKPALAPFCPALTTPLGITMDHGGNQNNDMKNMTNVNFVPNDIKKIISLHKFSKNIMNSEVFYKKAVL